jgi:hypothetical protein
VADEARRNEMGNTEKEPEAIADSRVKVGIEMVPNGPGQWILNLAGPQGLEIRPGDLISIDNVLLDELMGRSPDGPPIPIKFDAAETVPTTEPEDIGGGDWDALEREFEEIADLLLNNGEKAKTKVSRQQKEER